MKKQLLVLGSMIIAASMALVANGTPTPPVPQTPSDSVQSRGGANQDSPADTATKTPADTTNSAPTAPVLIPRRKRNLRQTKK
jgi:hypothetical protein